MLARREAVMSTRLAGAAVRVGDLVASEADEFAIPSAEVADARRTLDAMGYARRLLDSRGSSISQRALCELHRVLARGDEEAGRIRQSALWIGANRPEGAVFVPPPPQSIAEMLSSLERFIADDRDLPPIVRAGLVHVQLASIHPFSDGNGRIARLLVPVLLERWGALGRPVLCVSSFLRDNSREYYRRVDAVRSAGDWEGYTEFFLDAVAGAAEDSVATMRNLASLIATDRTRVLQSAALSAAALRLFELLPARPIVTMPPQLLCSARASPRRAAHRGARGSRRAPGDHREEERQVVRLTRDSWKR